MNEYIETYWPRLHIKWLEVFGGDATGQNVGLSTETSATTPKTLSLTFDDGPTPFGTRVLLDLLAKHQIQATFFVVGQNVVRYPELILEMQAAGHVVGNHSFNHRNPWKISSREMIRDYEKCNEVLASITNQQPKLIRPPFAKVARRTAAWCQRNGLGLTLWDVSIADSRTRKSIVDLRTFALKQVKPGSILRLHDNERSLRITPALLDGLIPRLKNDGWQFSTLDVSESQPSVAA